MTSREREPTFQEVNAAALAAYPRLLDRWFPKGHLQGREFSVGNLQGDAGHSLSVNILIRPQFGGGHAGHERYVTGQLAYLVSGRQRAGLPVGARALRKHLSKGLGRNRR